jgi:hypothetical protein
MSTIEAASAAFLQAIAEARDLNRSGADLNAIAELLRHARELLDIIEEEIADGTGATVRDARAVLAQLRERLESLERDVMPTTH